MKKCKLNRLISLYLDKEISPEELHELNQELESSESSRKKFKSAILFNKVLKERESFAEDITSIRTIAFTRYAKWSMGGLVALLLISFSCLLILNKESRNLNMYPENAAIIRPIRYEIKAPLRRATQHRSFQANFTPMNWESLKKDLQDNPAEMRFLRRQYSPQKQFDGFADIKLTQVSMPIHKQ